MLKSGLTNSAAETEELGREFGAQLSRGSVVALFGELGAGKTTFIKGLVQGGAGGSADQVQSPTFSYLNIYEGTKGTLYHFDLYRLRDEEAFLSMGFDEYFYSEGICCIEWSEKIEALLPDEALRVEIAHLGPEKRRISISG